NGGTHLAARCTKAMRRLLWISLLLVPQVVRAERVALPGTLSPETVEREHDKARKQKRDVRRMIRRHATQSLGFTKQDVDLVLDPTMILKGHFRLRLEGGTIVEFPWYRIGFAENELANTKKPIARGKDDRPIRRETNKGGVRVHFGVFEEEAYALALKMDL